MPSSGSSAQPAAGSKQKRSAWPLSGWKKKADGCYTRGTGDEKETKSRDELKTDVASYVLDLANASCCITSQGCTTTCKCLHFLSDKEKVISLIADKMIRQFDMPATETKEAQASDYRCAKRLSNPRHSTKKDGPERNYGLPFISADDSCTDEEREDVSEANVYGICEAAWSTLHNLGRKGLKTIKSIAEGKSTSVHGNTGKRNAETNENLEAKQSAKVFVQKIEDENGYEHAMRFVRDQAGMTSTREDRGRTFLPPSFSKRNCFMKWCASRGWKVAFCCKGKSKYKRVRDWELEEGFYKTQAEADANGGEVAQPIISYRSFMRMWKKDFPDLHVAQRGEDTCTDCHLLRLRLQNLQKKREQAERDIDEGGADDGTSPEELEEIVAELEAYMADAKKHCTMHGAQRELYNKYMKIAEDDLLNLVPLDLQTLFLVIDMSQNGSTPCLSCDQMGDFYYMSPLSHYIFGICEAAKQKMNCYIWEEGTANRGADNIISCLFYDLVRRGIIGNEGKPLKHLVLAADNCAGQNKNKAMIKFCQWLVEAGWVRKVTLLFLIKGHTKNDCDKMFNNLKQGTRGENIWTADDLDEAYVKANKEYIDLLRINENESDGLEKFWRAWSDGLGKLYRDPPSGTILINHIFEFGSEEAPNSQERPSLEYTCKEYRDADVINEYDLRPGQRQVSFAEINGMNADERATKVIELSDELDVLPAPGLTAIKANEMQNKIGPLAPEEKQQYFQRLTPVLAKEMAKIKQKKNSERKESNKAKKSRIHNANE